MGKITFGIDNDNGITAYPSQKEAEASGTTLFRTQHQLDQVSNQCTSADLIEIWNGIPGVEPVKKFTSRAVAIGRIWRAIQALAPEGDTDTAPQTATSREPEVEQTPDVAPQAADVGPKPAKPARKTTARKEPSTKPAKAEPRDSKKAQVIGMIQQPGGATLAAIMKATGWQAHTVRGFMATVPKKLGIEVTSTKPEGGERTYSVEASAKAVA